MVRFSVGDIIKPRQRCLAQVLSTKDFTGKKLLHLSYDGPVIETFYKKFGEVENSIYGEDNSIDITKIDRQDNTYDVILCIHILEHIDDDSSAITELYRILKPSGSLFIMVPQPTLWSTTFDWGYPNPDEYDHYRIYGKDIQEKLSGENRQVIVHKTIDTVSKKQEYIYEVIKGAKI